MGRIFLVILSLAMLSACNGVASTQKLVERQEVTVSAALEEIATGFSKMRMKLKEEKQVIGVIPCEINLKLNLTASQNKEDKELLRLLAFGMKAIDLFNNKDISRYKYAEDR